MSPRKTYSRTKRVPEKIATDCLGCPLFRKCEQHAMMLPLVDVPRYAAVA